jgi:FtsZ-binding cell division protein ZapB
MALTRKFLTAMGIEPDKIDEIITAHAETVDALKEERDKYKEEAGNYKADADKLKTVQAELDNLKESDQNSIYKAQYDKLKEDNDALQKEYNDYKESIAAKETLGKKKGAYKALLKEVGVSDNWIEPITRLAELDALELDENEKFKDSEKIAGDMKAKYSDYIVQEGTVGANTPTPPAGNGGNGGSGQSRAAKLAAKYHENLYGSTSE